MFKEIKHTKGALVKKALVEVLDQRPKIDKKTKYRKDIEEQVFDTRDAIADNAKLISLLTTLVSRIYSILPTSQTSLLSTADKDTIDYLFSKFAKTNTRADTQFSTEGAALIDKLLNRQAKINTIIV